MKTEEAQLNTRESNPIFTDVNLNATSRVSNLIIFTIKDFFYWWYIQMPVFYLRRLERISIVISDQLSIAILFKKFFTPWKRHKSLIGYFIGILVKLCYLPIAIPLYLLIISTYIILVIAWLLLPPTTIIFIFISLFVI